MSQHTPGPWGCVDTSNHAHDYRLTKPDGQPLRLHIDANDHLEQRANARLIAAAPEMLDLLKEAHDALALTVDSYNGTTNITMQRIQELVAKATSNIQTSPDHDEIQMARHYEKNDGDV